MEICGKCIFDDLPNLVDLDVFSEGTSTFTPTLALCIRSHTHTAHAHLHTGTILHHVAIDAPMGSMTCFLRTCESGSRQTWSAANASRLTLTSLYL